MKRKKKNHEMVVSLDEWVDNFTSYIAAENIKLIRSYGADKGDKALKKLYVSFLKNYLENVVLGVLTDYPKEMMDDREIYEYVSGHFKDLKYNIQIEIADAFNDAMAKFSGHYMDYYCEIKPVPEPVSDKAH
jgi:hypothetical protein